MIRDHEQHRNASDERVRVKQHDRELARERRRLASLVQQDAEYVDRYGNRVRNEDVLVEGEW